MKASNKKQKQIPTIQQATGREGKEKLIAMIKCEL